MNILTKDIEVFVDGSWCYPYLVMVPLNTLISGLLLYSMFGPKVIICYIGMFCLIMLQIFSNKILGKLQMSALKFSDERI
jgi:hypothetical protein